MRKPDMQSAMLSELPAAAPVLHVDVWQEAQRQPQELVNGIAEIQGDTAISPKVSDCLLSLLIKEGKKPTNFIQNALTLA